MPLDDYVVSCHQERGGRSQQEDAQGYFRPSGDSERRGDLFLMADGMGGASKGSTASSMAVEFFRANYYKITHQTPAEMKIPDLLTRLIPDANRHLVEKASEDERLWGMGTTLIASAMADGKLYWGSVGDSHLYLIRSGNLVLLNEDHSIAGEIKRLLAIGKITRETAQEYGAHGHKLLHYLGNPHFSHFDVCGSPLLLQGGDRIVLCTDGLYQNLEDADFFAILETTPRESAASNLVSEALKRGGPRVDNITAQVISIL